MENVVEVKNLVKRYKERVALDHLNLEIRKGGDLWSAGAQRFRQDNSY